MLQSTNPYTGEIVKTYTTLDEPALMQCIDKADLAYQEWRSTSIAERARLMKKVAELLRSNGEHYARLMTIEMGKLYKEGLSWEVKTCADIADYYADNAKDFLANEAVPHARMGNAHIEKLPIGVLFGIMPWNYPLYQVFRFICPNIMAGNVCLIKHSSQVPQCAEAIEQLFAEAGFPPGVMTNLMIRSNLAGKVIADDRVRGVSFTGSEGAGAKVAEMAGRHLKKVVLELGGSDPFIVLNDADLNHALYMAQIAKMFNTGQTCVAAKRFIVEADIYDDFVNGLAGQMSALQAGDPMNEDTGYGPMSSQWEADNLKAIIDEAVDMGATLLCGGAQPDMQGAWLEPTLLADVTKEMRAGREELFGPVGVIYKVESAEEAIKLANDSPYGLGSSIFSKDTDRAQDLASKLETGMTFINMVTASEPGLPFGGVKNSGFGRELSHLGMDEFINKKLVTTLPNYLVWLNGFLKKMGLA